jgi:hypothetical protein
MILFLFSDKTKLGDGVKIFPIIQDTINKKFKGRKYTFSVVVSDFWSCFSLAEQIYMKLSGEKESKLFRKTNSNDNLDPEKVAHKILKAREDIIICVTQYEGSFRTGILLSNLGAGEKELQKLLHQDFSKTFICFDKDEFDKDESSVFLHHLD